VVDLLHPGGEQAVQLDEAADGAPDAAGIALGADLDEELVADGAEEAFDFSSPEGFPG